MNAALAHIEVQSDVLCTEVAALRARLDAVKPRILLAKVAAESHSIRRDVATLTERWLLLHCSFKVHSVLVSTDRVLRPIRQHPTETHYPAVSANECFMQPSVLSLHPRLSLHIPLQVGSSLPPLEIPWWRTRRQGGGSSSSSYVCSALPHRGTMVVAHRLRYQDARRPCTPRIVGPAGARRSDYCQQRQVHRGRT